MLGRHVTFAVLAAATGCSLVYSSYDGRFQGAPGDDASSPPFVADDAGIKIQDLAVSRDGIFYTFAAGPNGNDPSIKRASLDGGGASPWWTGDASVTSLTGDGAQRLVWIAGGSIWIAPTSGASGAAATLPSGLDAGVQANGGALAAETMHLAWAGNVYPGRCPPNGCVVGVTASWAGAVSPLLVDVDASNVSPHSLSVDARGVTVQFQAERTSLHFAARFGADGRLACIVSWPEQERVSTAQQGSVVAMDTDGILAEFATTSAECPSTLVVKLAVRAVAYAEDDTGVYWVDDTGNVFAAGVGVDAGARVGSVSPAGVKTSIALDARFVYVAAGASIFRMSKSVGD